MRTPLGRALGAAVLLAAGALTAITTAAGPAQAVTPGTTGEVHAVGAGKCLDVPGKSTTAGTVVQIYDCNGGPNQLWTTTSSNQLTVYSGSSAMCLDASGQGTSAGTKVEIWTCNGGANQQWNINSNGTITGVQSGLCLDVTGASTANGAAVELWTCSGGANQQWSLGGGSSGGGGSSSAMAAVAAMQPGWGLGNSLDATPTETSWGIPLVTKSLFDSVRALGYNSVRIPVTWYPHMGAGPSYTVDPTWMSRVKQVVDWALSDNFYVILNVHHDSWNWIANMTTDPTGVLAEYNALWNQIAAEFQGESNKLVLESVNEPTFNGSPTASQTTQMLDQLNTAFFHDVRGSGGNNATRLLLLPTLGDTPTQALMDDLYSEIQSLNDPNLIASIHYYGYWPFSVNIAGETTFDATSQQDVVNAFGLAHSEFVARGIPVYAGEVGLLNYDYTRPGIIERGETLKYFEMLGYEARISGVTTNLWDAGSFVNRNTLQLRDAGLFAQIKSSWTTRSGTASSDMILVPRSGAISDQTLTLNLNGTTFQGLYQGSSALVNGSDYTVSGNQLTVKAAALSRLLGGRAYGVNATIQAQFSQGVPWQINLISYDTSTVSNANGTTSSFAVPTQFNGDVLATMEAKYADGSAAGPANWTTYQEYWTAFIPDYTNNAIDLTSDFFNALTDGSRVTLTFHFWSGRTVTYYVTKSGSSVTGTTY